MLPLKAFLLAFLVVVLLSLATSLAQATCISDKVRLNRNLLGGYWYGARPRGWVEHRSAAAQAMIPQIEAAIKSYPWPTTYHV